VTRCLPRTGAPARRSQSCSTAPYCNRVHHSCRIMSIPDVMCVRVCVCVCGCSQFTARFASCNGEYPDPVLRQQSKPPPTLAVPPMPPPIHVAMLLWPDARSKPRAALSHDQFVDSQIRYCCCCRVCGCHVRLPSLGSCTPIPRCLACTRYLRTHYLDTHDTPAIQCRYLRLAWEFLCQTALGSDGDVVDALLRGDDSCLTARNGACDEAMARGTDALRRQATCLPGTDSTDCRRTLATPEADLPATTLTLWSTDYHTGPCMCACACACVAVQCLWL